jgi:MFS transporter, PAT family, solute carrier family 33 (acetyl-CoA transportor), member 1
MQPDKETCVNGGGTCELLRDGFYYVNIICVIFGVVTFVMYIRPKVLHLQSLPLRAWRLAGGR